MSSPPCESGEVPSGEGWTIAHEKRNRSDPMHIRHVLQMLNPDGKSVLRWIGTTMLCNDFHQALVRLKNFWSEIGMWYCDDFDSFDMRNRDALLHVKTHALGIACGLGLCSYKSDVRIIRPQVDTAVSERKTKGVVIHVDVCIGQNARCIDASVGDCMKVQEVLRLRSFIDSEGTLQTLTIGRWHMPWQMT